MKTKNKSLLKNNHVVSLIHKHHIVKKICMCHAACKVDFQPFNRSYSQLRFFSFSKKGHAPNAILARY